MSDDIEVREKTILHQGFFKVERYVFRHRQHAGGLGPEISREVFERGNAAAVLPYDPARDAVVLVEQFRIGAHVAGHPPWLLEVVAGIIEPGEGAADVARRETVEEAGLTLGRMERIGEVIVSPGGCSETITLFCGEVNAAEESGIFGLAQEGEDILAIRLSVDDAMARLERGEIIAAPAVISLQWLALNHADLRARWLASGAAPQHTAGG